MNVNVGYFKKFLETASDDTDMSELLPVKTIAPDFVTELPINAKVATVKHSCNPGDVIASLIACKRFSEITGRKVRYLQRVGMPGTYYHGATHPTLDANGVSVTMNDRMFNLLKPLVESQNYIASFEVYNGQSFDVDFDAIRGKTFVNMPQGSIQAWLFYAFPNLASDISKQWIFLDKPKQQIEEVVKGKVILNFTERYRNSKIFLEYFFLQAYAPDLIFAGTEQEHFKFCHQWGLNIPLLETKNFLEDAYALRGCMFLLSNQSWMWNAAEALKTPRLLEVCDFAHNCMPFYGENSKGYFHQASLEHYFREMYNDLKNK
jgi:hypothetical protein